MFPYEFARPHPKMLPIVGLYHSSPVFLQVSSANFHTISLAGELHSTSCHSLKFHASFDRSLFLVAFHISPSIGFLLLLDVLLGFLHVFPLLLCMRVLGSLLAPSLASLSAPSLCLSPCHSFSLSDNDSINTQGYKLVE
ncbi:hypothetical protein ABKN59_010748 [Abortiporus biennis]